MLSYYKGGYNDYMIRTAQLPSGSKFLLLSYQDMITLENSSVLFDTYQWSYNACESFVSFSVNFDINTDYPVGTEFRLTLTPAVSTSTIPFTYMDDVWNGSIQFYASQSIDKPVYKTQNDEFISYASDNEFIIVEPFITPTTTTTTTIAPTTTTTTTLAPTTTTTTLAPGTPDVIWTFGNQFGGMGFNVCYSATNTSAQNIGVQFTAYSCFMSSDSGCTTPYGTSWDLNGIQSDLVTVGGVTGNFPTTTGGDLNGTYYRTRISGTFQFDVPGAGLPFSPLQSFDLSGSAYQDLTYGGYTVRIQGPNCNLNDNSLGQCP